VKYTCQKGMKYVLGNGKILLNDGEECKWTVFYCIFVQVLFFFWCGGCENGGNVVVTAPPESEKFYLVVVLEQGPNSRQTR
jgi:hypothetical protein